MQNPYDIERKMILIEEISDAHTICYSLEGTEYRLTVVVKNTTEAYTLLLHHSEMIFDGRKASSIQQDKYCLENVGVYIFKEVK